MDEAPIDIWYEEELVPSEITVEHIAKSIASQEQSSSNEVAQQLRRATKGVVRADRPRWIELDPIANKLLISEGGGRFYMVRLGFQFAVMAGSDNKNAHFIYARCSARLWGVNDSEPQPRAYDVIPGELYDGEPRKVSVKLSPQIQIGSVGSASLGEISTDISVGTVEPVCLGFTGDEEREPYWELRPSSKLLQGLRHLWLILESPKGCSGIRLATMVEGDIQSHFGPIPVGPRVREWSNQSVVVIK